MFIAVQLLIVKLEALPQFVHLVYGDPTTLGCREVMWNILIQTACSYTIGKYFKQLIKYQQLAICLQLCCYLQSNLQLCRSLYTWCTEIRQLWDVENVMWNILIQTASQHASQKDFKQLIKISRQLYVYNCIASYRQIFRSAIRGTLDIRNSHNCGMLRKSCGPF